LLFSVPPESAHDLEREFASRGLNLWRIGKVVEGSGIVLE
jgi:hypothetical protein